MAEATRTDTYDVTPEQYYKAITDYGHYPNLIPVCNETEVLEDRDGYKKVKYTLKIVKSFSYTCQHNLVENQSMTIDLIESGLFKHMKGSWKIEDEGGKARVTYDIDIGLPRLAPKAVVDKLVGSTLPEMMQSFADHAKSF